MKHSSLTQGIFVTAALLTAFAWTYAAQTADPKSGASTANAATSAASSSTAVNYVFDDTPLDRANTARITSYADMLDKVTPAVVSVHTTQMFSQALADSTNNPFNLGRGRNNQPPADGSAGPLAGDRQVPYGVGSGSIITSDGYIITNHHVVCDERTDKPSPGIAVELSDGRIFEAKYIGSDKSTDIALIKIDAKNLPTLKMADSNKLKVGDLVFAVGDPMEVGLTVTQGIVSALGRNDDDKGIENFIQTDASINPGNSGGPLVDASGRLVGLNSEILSPNRGGGNIGIGFSIPSVLARHVVNSLIADGAVKRGFLGVELNPEDLDHDLARALGLDNVHGALISYAFPEKPAYSAGVRTGDVVVKIDDQEVDNSGKLKYLTAMASPGDVVALKVVRDGQLKDFKVKLADLPVDISAPAPDPVSNSANGLLGQGAPGATGLQGGGRRGGGRRGGAPPPVIDSSALEGIALAPMTDALRQRYHIPSPEDGGPTEGVVVTAMAQNSPYADTFNNSLDPRISDAPGAVLMEVNKHAITTVDDVTQQLKTSGINLFYVYMAGHHAFEAEAASEQPVPAATGGGVF